MMVTVFANRPEDLGSILGRVIPKTQQMVLDAALLNTQHYKVQIKGKVEQSRARSSQDKGDFTLPKSPALELHHQMEPSVILGRPFLQEGG